MFAKAVGGYFFEIFWQGIVLGTFGLLAWYVAWPYKWLAIIAGLYILWRVPKNPRTHWKRMFSLLMGMLALDAGLQLLGTLNLELEWLQVYLEGNFSLGLPTWGMLLVAGIIAVVDAVIEVAYIRQVFRNGRIWGKADGKASPVTATAGQPGFQAKARFTVGLEGGNETLKLTDISFRLKSLLWWLAADDIPEIEYRNPGEEHWHEGWKNAQIAPGETLELSLVFNVVSGKKAKQLFWWTRRIPLMKRQGVVNIEFNGEEGRRLTVGSSF